MFVFDPMREFGLVGWVFAKWCDATIQGKLVSQERRFTYSILPASGCCTLWICFICILPGLISPHENGFDVTVGELVRISLFDPWAWRVPWIHTRKQTLEWLPTRASVPLRSCFVHVLHMGRPYLYSIAIYLKDIEKAMGGVSKHLWDCVLAFGLSLDTV